VAGRIASNIFRSFPEAALLDLKITKVNPPMGAHCDGASVVMSFERTPDDSLAESC
jgi:dihydroneopterin aldolase